ncbi:peroxisome proliferator-activated receptor gamma coactivator-related protein 1 isoform X2 [Phyllobates terribilis]|uniref:peroxisome proliferator-activated receptor gamma coactivator-related protein 1 isoform X2 n=1 Tax=Phyllobates terribilis TaxID=111132 RepID=UPI003CCA78CD
MAARWGAGDGTLTIGGMELFTAAGSLQCHNLEEDETCDGLSDLTLSSLDAGGILETFQGYIDNSIISIIDDPAAQAEKGLYDDENELSLLTALTEILDNADDEKMSPFDSIPDTELLVSPKDREGSAKLFALSRTPPDHDMFSLDGQRRATPSKISGPNWELFPDAICSTPKRRTRRKSLIACLPRRAEAEETQQRSDGEDEELLCVIDKSPGVLTHDNNLDVNDGDPDQILIHGTPCIINTEKFALSELVKYMHPYCLPAITMCLESEDDENLKDAVFLEIVSEQGECIKVPVVVEPPADILCPESSDEMTGMDVEMENLPNHLSSSEKVAPELEVHDYIKKADGVHEELTESVTVVPKLQDSPPQHPPTNIIVKSPDDDDSRNSEEVVPDCKNNSEPDIAAPIVSHEKLPQKVKRSGRAKKPSKSKSKSKAKIGAEDKSPDAPEPIPVQSVAQPPTIRPTNPSLQESDFLVKTLDQVKKESQMELRSSKTGRAKARTRASMDTSNTERKVAIVKIKTVSMESERAKSAIDVGKDLEQNPKVENPVSAETLEPATKAEVLQSDNENIKDILVPSDVCNGEESGASKVEDVQDGDSLQMKEAKPKSLSLSEYRKRLQHRQPKPARENENLSCSKWPTVPETPTELAELPCLIVPGQSMKPSVEEKACPPKKASNSGREIPVSSAPVPAPITNQEVHHLNENLRPAGTVVAPPAITPQPNVPPQFYPPVWPTVAPHPSFYPGMPPLAAVPHYPNSMPAVLPVQPPPVMSWPPFPPPPIAVPPVHPTGWVPGPPTPYWPNVQMAQGMPEIQSLHNSSEKSVPFAASNLHVLPVQEGRKESVVPAVERRPQAYRIPAMKPENSVGPKEPKNDVTSKCLKSNSSSLSMKAAKKSQNAPVPEPKKENILIPDMKSANQMVFKIMEILKKAQKLGFQIKPASKATIESAQPGIPVPPSVLGSKPAQPGQTVPTNIKMLVGSILPTQETPAMVPDVSSKAEKTIEKFPAQEVAEDKVAAEPVVLPRAEPIGTSEESFQTTADSDPKESEKSFACESGIEATDLTSLLEQFEKSEAKEEERLPQSPDKLAVGNSGLGKTLEKKIHEKQLAPELVNTAGLTPPATPPHQLWKSVVTRPVTGKSRSLHGQEKTCSPLKTAKLIEPKPLPQSLLKSRSVVSSPTVSVPPVHVASGDHDYCILSSQQAENKATPAPSPASCEEGSRWNVKHHPNITIKPIVQFNKQQQLKAFPKPPAPSAPSAVANQSTTCGPVIPIAPCESIRKASTDPLDHRTNVMAESAVVSAPASVLMSPDSSPCRSENGESRTDVKRGDASSRRALRCYRKYKGSPSPKKSWRDRTSGSGSGSRSSSSSSRSRSGSPASKRRRTSRYRSRSRHRSRSSSRSSYGTSGSSRSSSCSSRSCTPSSSQSRSRSPSPYGRRGRSRSRRCESRESYNRRKMFHKERAIEERRVVYIGKINSLMTRSELSRRFSIFGEIEECTIHFREEGDNYGFVTYRCTREAFAAIENGHKLRLPDELPFDLCFGGRRQFCKSNYADLDSNRDDFDPAPVRSKFEALDFDTLLKQAQKNHRR